MESHINNVSLQCIFSKLLLKSWFLGNSNFTSCVLQEQPLVEWGETNTKKWAEFGLS